MNVLVQHTISDPDTFFEAAANLQTPAHLKLHQTFPSVDRAHCVCIWEAESVAALRGFLEPATGRISRNEYFEVVNSEGIALPAQPMPPIAG